MIKVGRREFDLAAGIHQIPLLFLLLALVLFAFGYRGNIHFERDRVDAERSEALDRIEGSLTLDLKSQIDLLLSINAFFGASTEVTRVDFQRFLEVSDTFERNPELLAVEWAPLLLHEQLPAFVQATRDDRSVNAEGYPSFDVAVDETRSWHVLVSYVEPYEGNEQALGFDLSSSAVHLEAIELARKDRAVVASEPIRLVGQPDSTTGMWLVSPIFDGASPNEEDGFVGVALTVFDIDRLITDSLVDLPAFVLADRGRVGLPLESESSFIFESDDSTTPSDAIRSMQIAGRRWEIALGTGVIDPPSNVAVFWRMLPQLIAILAVTSALWVLSRNSGVSQRRARDLTVEVQEKNRELRRSNEWLASFTRVASHDLRSPLRAVTSLVGFIREDNPHLEESAMFNLSRIEQRVHRMNVLIDDLLTLARISDAAEKCTEVRFDEVVEEVLLTVDIPQSFTVETAFSGRASGALAAVQFETCVRNLVDNAVKHHDEDSGLVKIDVTATDDVVEVVVNDDGPGIPTQYLESVFEPFRRLNPDDEAPGSGIGLTSILRTAENNDGSISVESTEGVGTTFTLRWPIEGSSR